MRIHLRDDLPFVTLTLHHAGTQIEITDVLVDTGAARTVIAADSVARVGIRYGFTDRLQTMRGVGGAETVYSRKIDRLAAGERGIDGFMIQVGGMDYGFDINGILGMDFLRRTGAIVDLKELRLRLDTAE